MYRNRKEAAQKLLPELQRYAYEDALILGVLNGGVEIAFELASELHGELGFVIVQELRYPEMSDTGFGAVAEDGTEFVSTAARKHLSLEEIDTIVENAKHAIQNQIKVLRHENAFPRMHGRTVIVVDDGMAPASVVQAVVELCNRQFAKRVVVALPTANERLEQVLESKADEVIIPHIDRFFSSPQEQYESLPRATREDVLAAMSRWHQMHQEADHNY